MLVDPLAVRSPTLLVDKANRWFPDRDLGLPAHWKSANAQAVVDEGAGTHFDRTLLLDGEAQPRRRDGLEVSGVRKELKHLGPWPRKPEFNLEDLFAHGQSICAGERDARNVDECFGCALKRLKSFEKPLPGSKLDIPPVVACNRPLMHQRGDDRRADFTQTRWSLVLLAGHPSASQASLALEKLCQTYWHPVYAFVRRHNHAPHDAQDLTQEFFAQLLRKNFFTQADPDKGRFRSFLLSSLKFFLADQRDTRSESSAEGAKPDYRWRLGGEFHRA